MGDIIFYIPWPEMVALYCIVRANIDGIGMLVITSLKKLYDINAIAETPVCLSGIVWSQNESGKS